MVSGLLLALLVTSPLAGADTSRPDVDHQPAPPVVRVGLERVADELIDVLAGHRVALVAHAASVTHDGRHAIDVLLDEGIEIVRVLAPEHGLRGRAAAGEPVADGRDARTGLPVVSLYGATRTPTAAALTGIDTLVFDLQGAGVRFYTYVSTLMLCLEAAAEHDVTVVVLDRPNPLGGVRIAGPEAAPRDVVPSSFVNQAPGPLIHGLTMGEMARYVNQQRERPARLSVVPMQGWRRTMTWRDTGRTWVSPSPNLRSPEAALAYPGTALLEATNVSEGRGTEAPFLLLGAPDLAPATRQALHDLRVPGFTVEPVTFTPRGDTTAPNPKHEDATCHGVRVKVSDAHGAEPFRLGLHVLAVLQRDPSFRWRGDQPGQTAALTWLLGTPAPLAVLRAGLDGNAFADATVDIIVDADADTHARWRIDRRRALLYP